MSRIAIAVALSLLAMLNACKRETAPAATTPAVEATAAEEKAAPTDAIAAVDNTPAVAGVAAAAAFDAKAYAGTFSAQGVTLDIRADGTFTLEQAGADAITGTWTLPEGGKQLLLDPDSKSEADRRYQMVGNDELQPAGDAATRLRRAGT